MGSVVPFRDPDRPLEGAARTEALKRLRVAMPEIAEEAFNRLGDYALKHVVKIGFGKLGVSDIVPMILKGLRRELRRRQ